jgi:hypothetical protein
VIALDIATTTGLCKYNRNSLTVTEIASVNPITQFKAINKFVGKDTDVLIEQFVYFGSGNSSATINSLVERIGYIKFKLLELDKKIELINPTSYQSWFIKTFDLKEKLAATKHKKSKKKMVIWEYLKEYYKLPKLTNNHTDAIAMVIYKNKLERLPKTCKIIS